MPDFGFKDRNYIVTGGAGSIGRAVVEIIVSCGGNVTAVDLDGATLRELGSVLPEGRYRYKTADLSSPEEIRSVFAEITEAYGQIHGLVNCVGVLCTTPITEVTQEEWDRVIAINLTGVFAAIQSVLPNMLSNHCGSIVNVSSVAGKLGGGLLHSKLYWDEEQKTLAPSGMAGASGGRRISTRERDGAENTGCVSPARRIVSMAKP